MQLTKTWDKQQQQGEEHEECVGAGKEGRIRWWGAAAGVAQLVARPS